MSEDKKKIDRSEPDVEYTPPTPPGRQNEERSPNVYEEHEVNPTIIPPISKPTPDTQDEN